MTPEMTKWLAHLIIACQAFNDAMENWYDGPEHPATPELLDAWDKARKALVHPDDAAIKQGRRG